VKKDKCTDNSKKRVLGVASVAVVFLLLAIPAVKFAVGQIYYQQGVYLVQKSDFSRALTKLNRAVAWLPKDASIQYELGITHLQMALGMDGMLQDVMTAKAVEYFQQSQSLNPLNPETVYGLARASELLGENTREQTLAAYRRAVELWPNNSLYRKAFARELYRQYREVELLATVQVIGTIDPGSFGQLQREPYWNDKMAQVYASGVEEAAAQDIAPRQAYMTLSSILAQQGKWIEAAREYQKGMGYEPHSNSEHNFYRLGLLLFHSDSIEATKVMLLGLVKSTSRELDLERLYNGIRDASEPETQLDFYREVRKRFPLTWRLEILMARTLIDGRQYDEARSLLEQIALQEETPEPWYWLYRIGELMNDVDAMELAIQKASVRDPDNSEYHLLFSRVLARQKKYASAEQQAGRALETAKKNSAGLYGYRAGLRWNQKNYRGALEDWQEASRLQPENSAFYGQIGQAYKILGEDDLAMNAFTKALERDPNNVRYIEELKRK
jgi:tetratricopeptide (TPR) repeat protein